MITNKTIMTDLITVINTAITEYKITGFKARQGAQPYISTNVSPSFFIDMIEAPRYGWQHQEDKVINNKLIHDEIFYQEAHFQITALKKRNVNIDEITAVDAINLLAAYLNSENGIYALRGRGYGVIRITDVRTGYYVSDSDVYERCPSFDVILNFRQVIRAEIPEISNIVGQVKGV